MYHSFFNLELVEGNLSSFQVQANTNRASMNVHVQVFM